MGGARKTREPVDTLQKMHIVVQCKSYPFIMDQNGISEETEGRNAVLEFIFLYVASFAYVWKIRKINGASSGQATSFKHGEYNLLPSFLTLRFTHGVNFHFQKTYLPSGSHTNNVISTDFAYP